MDKGRVGACNRTENKRRKFLFVLNDVVRAKWSTYNEFLTREAEETDYRFEKSKRFVRRALVRQRVLQQCMKARKDALRMKESETLYGRYGGKPVDAFSREIESFIAENHPKVRRVRKIQQLMDRSIATGAILDKQVIADKMASYFERSLTKMRLKRMKKEKTRVSEEKPAFKDQKRYGLPKLPVLANPFYTGNKANNSNESPRETTSINVLTLSTGMEKVSLQEARSTVKEGPERTVMRKERELKSVLPQIRPVKSQADNVQETKTVTERPKLVLPPIKSTKALVAQ